MIRAEEAFEIGQKIRFSCGEDLFFGGHLILGGKTVSISDFGRKFRLNFGEDLFFWGGITCFWAEKPFQIPILGESV